MGIFEIRRADTRDRTRLDWLESWHSFNFNSFRAPGNDRHGLLRVFNDDIVAPGGGFGEHGHADMEIVTYILDGALEHRDSMGTHGVIRVGEVQRMSAGSGIRHSELNASGDAPVHLLQMWVLPDDVGLTPEYDQRDYSDALAGGGLVCVASGMGHDGAMVIHQRDAAMWVGRLAPGAVFALPDAAHVHLFVARGSVTLDGTTLGAGDALRSTDLGPIEGVAGETADGDGVAAEIIIWQTA